jgi:hypothetical protein
MKSVRWDECFSCKSRWSCCQRWSCWLLVAVSPIEVLLLTFHKNLLAYEFDLSTNIYMWVKKLVYILGNHFISEKILLV